MDRPMHTPTAERDGTSQVDRLVDALRTDYVSVDERSIEDLVRFSREFCRGLRYHGTDGAPAGDWSGFLPPDLSDRTVAQYAAAPHLARSADTDRLQRPHFTLWLVLLQMMERCQREVNGFTARHLDHYYRSVLGMSPLPPVADSVHVVVTPTAAASEVLVPAGTLLGAGPDDLGQERTYAVDRDLVVNHAGIEAAQTVHLERRITDLAAARDAYRNDRHGAMLALFRLALGRPRPGDELPAYPGAPGLDGDLLDELAALVAFAESDLHLRQFELRDIMRLKTRRDEADDDWKRINDYLNALAAHRGVDVTVTGRDFDANLQAAVGGTLPDFDDVPEVETVDDLYEFWTRTAVQEAIRDDLGFTDVRDFVAMMQIKVRIDGEWREVNRLLDIAGRRRRGVPTFTVDERPGFDPSDFDANVAAAIGNPAYPARVEGADLDGYYREIQTLETYFSMTAEEFLYVVRTAGGDGAWEQADRILTDAHVRVRRAELRAIREDHGVETMLLDVLGEQQTSAGGPALLDRLEPYLDHPSDAAVLGAAIAGNESVDGDDVDAVSERAKRNREGLAGPAPVRREWVDLHAAPDATALAVTVGTDDAARWPTFGSTGDDQDPSDPPPPVLLGTALSSPLLALAEGRRTIDLVLGCDGEPEALAPLADALTFELSTPDGWAVVEPAADGGVATGTYGELGSRNANGTTTAPAELARLSAIRFRLPLDESAAPVTALTGVESGPGTEGPTLRLSLRRRWSDEDDRFTMPYPAVRDVRVRVIRLVVDVDDLVDLRLRNDVSDLDPSGPFEPFTVEPTVGSRLLIGHHELATKELDRLRFDFEWMGVPSNLATNYYSVGYGLRNPTRFRTKVTMVDRRTERTLIGSAPLFRPSVADPAAIEASSVGGGRLPRAATEGDVSTWDRYFAWELRNPDFQHGAYARVAAAKAIELAAAVSREGGVAAKDAKNYQVNPPYTPKLKGLRVGYSSSIELRLDRPHDGPECLYHLHPFGFDHVPMSDGEDGVALVPRYDHEGELYLGLRGLRPPQAVSFLFQMAEGSADPDIEPAAIEWSYGSGGSWIPLRDRVLADATRGLVTSGIVELSLPEAEPSTLLDPSLYWVRATAADRTASVADTVAIRTQAVSATFTDAGNSPDHYARPLPAGSITKTVGQITGVASVEQPYTSAGGRPAEDPALFATRVSERLRHKGRALTMWDYEHLVLQHFPQLYKVKCIAADPAPHAGEVGRVDLVVIPDIRNRLPFNAFEPKAPPELLAEIQEFLTARAPDAATIRVTNAHFRFVRARFGVRFSHAGNEEFLTGRLIEELDRFLAPWAYDEGADIVIGSRIYATSLIDFLDRRDYVDYVADLRLFHSDDGERYTPAPEDDDAGYSVPAGRADGVLRAAPTHDIFVIRDEGYHPELMTGIGHMKLELDFIIG